MNSREPEKTSQTLWDILHEEHKKGVQEAEKYIAWYEHHRMWKRNASRLLRALSIIAVAVGTLCPLIDAASPSTTIRIGQWGYVAFALAAAFVGGDRFFGVSSSWMRFTSARMELERVLTEFTFDWKLLTAEIPEETLQGLHGPRLISP